MRAVRLLPSPIVLQALGDAVAHGCLVLAAISLFGIVAINGANVFCRYFLDFAFSWAPEAMIFLMILMVFAGAVAAAWRGAHMHLDMFIQRLAPKWQRATIFFTVFFSVALLAVLSRSSFQVIELLYRFGQKSLALALPMWIPQGCVLVGFVLIAVMMLLRLAVFGATISKSEAETVRDQQC